MPHAIFEDLTLERFLRLPEAKPALEFIDGKVVQKVSPKRSHGTIQLSLGSTILSYAQARKLGRAYSEIRCIFGGMALVPDLVFIRKGRIPKDARGKLEEDVFLAPDLMIEVISPGQTVKSMLVRLNRSVAAGVRLGWLIQPRRARVFVVGPGTPTVILEPGSILDGGDVLPGFTLPLAELFAWLDED
jgi:Uma2 family endonuclease